VNVNVPVAEPPVVGEKVTPTVQLAPAATLVPHVLLATANGPLTPLTATVFTVSVVFRRFVSVIVSVELASSTTLPKLKLVGEKVIGAPPLPESVTLCVPALSVIVTLPETAPTTVGANDTWMVHEAAGAIGPLQLLLWLNGAEATTLETCSGPVPLLRTVMVRGLLVVPTTCVEKESDVGVIEATGVVPVPLRVITCEEPRLKESSVRFSDPVTGPAADGVKETATVQLVAATRTEGQLFVGENTPDVPTVKLLIGLPPKFVTVTFWGVLVVLTFCEKVSAGGL
jgi:hypothetical protein